MIENIDYIQKLIREIESLAEVLAICLEDSTEYPRNNPMGVIAWIIRDKAEKVSNYIRNSIEGSVK